ncbi:MAG: hypothetical protein IKI49_06645 [Oscillospiraceae bacterium]|nr:hypothetical protein [Oscillospiraceae bacterium]
MPLLALIAGVGGYFIRKSELIYAIDPVTRLAQRWSKYTLLLVALSVVVTVVFEVYIIIKLHRGNAPKSYNALSANGLLSLFAAMLGGAAISVGGVIYYLSVRKTHISVTDYAFVLFAVLSGITQISLALGAWRRKSGSSNRVASVVAPLFFCLWLVIFYRKNSTDPELLNYALPCFALMAALLSLYFSAGFAFDRGNARYTLIFSFLASYLCIAAMADFTDLYSRLILAGAAAISAVNAASIAGNIPDTES